MRLADEAELTLAGDVIVYMTHRNIQAAQALDGITETGACTGVQSHCRRQNMRSQLRLFVMHFPVSSMMILR